MSESADATLVGVALAAALLMFALELVLAVALVSAVSLSRVALRRLSAEAGDRLSFLEQLKAPPSTYRSTAVTVKQLSLLGGCLFVGLAAAAANWPHPWAVGLLAGAVFGAGVMEGLLARILALRDPRAALLVTARVVWLLHPLLYPLMGPLNRLLQGVSRSSSREEVSEEEQGEEVDAFIEVGEREGILEADEGKMMRSIADLDETRVREIMTPRTDIQALPDDILVAEARRALIEAAHSRMPAYGGTIDNVTGVLHARDLFRAWQERREDAGIKEFLRPALFVPETLTVAELLAEMRLRTQVAMVVDEYGGIAGLVTLEDLLEEIVGDIRDEHDLEESLVLKQQDGSWLLSGVAHVKQLESLFGIEVGERDFDTVGGLVVAGFGRVPTEGETLRLHGLDFEVLQANRTRVYRVRIRRAADRSGTEARP